MRKSLLASTAVAACLAVVTVVPSEVASDGPYVSLFGGVNFLTDSTTNYYGEDADVDFDAGFVVGGAAGFAFNNGFRAEFELAYRSNTVEEITTPEGYGAYVSDGEMNALSLMVNVWYDFETGTDFRPFVGGGIGGALVNQEQVGGYEGYDWGDDQDGAFALQVGAGVAVDMGRAELTLEYRFFSARGVDISGSYIDPYGEVDADYDSHSIMVGFRLPIGGGP